MSKNNIAYTGVLLDDESSNYLKEYFKDTVPNDWMWYAHHMTITLGKLSDEIREEMLGKEVILKVNSIGIDDKVIAVGVYGFYTKNDIPHITIAVDKKNGGTPKLSKVIPNEKWKPLNLKKQLKGIVTEVPR